jgi:hypothetical protein
MTALARITAPFMRTLGMVCFVTVAGAVLAAERTQPNLLLIMTDDQGSWDLGSSGNPHIAGRRRRVRG